MSTATKAPPADTGRCGERAGYRRHRKAGEQPCRPCVDAENAAQRDRRVRIRPRPCVASAVRLNARSPFGRMAATSTPHRFVPMDMSQCRECFGWRDDPRHPVVGGPVVGR